MTQTASDVVRRWRPSFRVHRAGVARRSQALGRGDLLSLERFGRVVLPADMRIALEGDRPVAQVAADLGLHRETLRKKVRQAEADSGQRMDLLNSQEREEVRRLRKENYEPPRFSSCPTSCDT